MYGGWKGSKVAKMKNYSGPRVPPVSMRLRKPIPIISYHITDHISRGLIETAGYMKKKFQFYLPIFGCSLPETHNFSCWIPRSQ
jgi:hypothetical protein